MKQTLKLQSKLMLIDHVNELNTIQNIIVLSWPQGDALHTHVFIWGVTDQICSNIMH